MLYTIYHNTRCKKSRGGLQYLEEKGIKPQVVEYLKDEPFTVQSLTEVIKKLGIKPQELIRTHEAEYKKNFKGKGFTDQEWIKILVENPKFIRRPIIVKGDKAVVGDIVEHIDELL